MEYTCFFCKWWNAPPKENGAWINGDWAECRFNPPQVIVLADSSTPSVWPLTRAPQWCSHFERDPKVI